MWETLWSNGRRAGPWLRGPGSRPGWVGVLCSWEKHFTLTMPLFNQEYKGVLESFQESLMKCFFFGGRGGCPCNGLASYPGGSIANPGYFMLRTQTFLPSNMITSKLRSHVSRTNNF